MAYGEEEDLLRAWGLLEVAARLLRLRARERSVERMQEETLGGALLEGLILGEADPERLFAFGFVEGVEWVLALVEPPAVLGRHRLAEERRREATLELRRRVGAYLDRLGVPYLLTARGNRVAAMWQVHNPRREAERLLQALPREAAWATRRCTPAARSRRPTARPSSPSRPPVPARPSPSRALTPWPSSSCSNPLRTSRPWWSASSPSP